MHLFGVIVSSGGIVLANGWLASDKHMAVLTVFCVKLCNEIAVCQ